MFDDMIQFGRYYVWFVITFWDFLIWDRKDILILGFDNLDKMWCPTKTPTSVGAWQVLLKPILAGFL